MFQQSVTTYQAYNPYGGTSLYVGGGTEVSFDLPYAEGRGAGQYFRYEHEFVKWAESRGLDLVYVTNLDLERDPDLLTGRKLFLSVGHDEYWSRPMRDALEAAIARGVHAAFFSGNGVYWQIRASPIPGRGDTIVVAPVTPIVLAGVPGEEGLRDGHAADALFRRPTAAALDGHGRLWVTDTGNHAVRVIAAETPHEVETVVGDGVPGAGDGAGARLRFPQGIAIADDGTPYVADSGNQRVVRLRSGEDGWRIETVAGATGWQGDADGQGTSARFWDPAGLAFAEGALFVADRGNGRIRRIDASGTVRTIAGATGGGFADGPGLDARFTRPSDLAAAAGALLVLDAGNRAIRRVALAPPHEVATLAGGTGGFGDGPAREARFMPASGIVLAAGGLLVADAGNARVRTIREGQVSTWAGAEATSAGVPRLEGPTGLVVLPNGTIVVDGASSTIRLVGEWTPADVPSPPAAPPPPPPRDPAKHAAAGGCASAPGAAPGVLAAVILLGLLRVRISRGRFARPPPRAPGASRARRSCEASRP